MGFALQHGLVKMGHAPPLGDVEAEAPGEGCGGLAGGGVAPGAEGRKLPPGSVEGQVAVHHGGNAQRPHPGKRRAGFGLPVRRQRGEGGAHARLHLFQMIGPPAVLQPVLPVVCAAGQRRARAVHQHRLDAGGAQFQAKDGRCEFIHNVPPHK